MNLLWLVAAMIDLGDVVVLFLMLETEIYNRGHKRYSTEKGSLCARCGASVLSLFITGQTSRTLNEHERSRSSIFLLFSVLPREEQGQARNTQQQLPSCDRAFIISLAATRRHDDGAAQQIRLHLRRRGECVARNFSIFFISSIITESKSTDIF